MSDLIVVGFSDTEKADRALTKMVSLSKEHLVELEDAVIVVRNAEGKIHIKQSVNLTAIGATSGLVCGAHWSGCCFSTRWQALPSAAHWAPAPALCRAH